MPPKTISTKSTDKKIELKNATPFPVFLIEINDMATILYLFRNPINLAVHVYVLKVLNNHILKNIDNSFDMIREIQLYDHCLKLLEQNGCEIKISSMTLLNTLINNYDYFEKSLVNDSEKILFIYNSFNDYNELCSEIEEEYYAAAASLLAKLINDNNNLAENITENCNINILFKMIDSSDPDLKYNILLLFHSLLLDIISCEILINNTNFSFNLFTMATVTSNYPDIQIISLDIILWLMKLTMTNELKYLFLKENGLDRIFEVLNHYDWIDIHPKCFSILNHLCQLVNTIIILCENNGVQKLIDYIINIDCEISQENCLKSLIQIANNPIGRKTLVKNNVIDLIAELLLDPSMKIVENISYLMGKLVKDDTALRQLTVENSLALQMQYYSDFNDQQCQHAIVTCWHELFSLSKYFIRYFLDNDGFRILMNSLNSFHERNDDSSTINLQIMLIDTLSVLLTYADVRDEILDENLMNLILNQTTHNNSKNDITLLKISSLNSLSSLMEDEKVRCFFKKCDGSRTVSLILKTSNKKLSIIEACSILVFEASKYDRELAIEFIREKVLDWLFDNKSLKLLKNSYAMEKAIDILFKRFLPAKFSYLGYLEMDDITENGFFVKRNYYEKSSPKFQTIDDLYERYCCPIRPIYIVNFQRTSNHKIQNVETKLPNKFQENYSKEEDCNVSMIAKKLSQFSLLSDDETQTTLCDLFGKCLEDPFLIQYDKILKQSLNISTDTEWLSLDLNQLFDNKKILSTINVLSTIVFDAMSGPVIAENPCKNHSLELHLKELKLELSTSLIPIGYVKIGRKLERALLFKILADRIGFPCRFVTNDFVTGWIEVVIYPNSGELPHCPILPAFKLQTTHIVDLMKNDEYKEKLLSLNSDEALDYMGKPRAYKLKR